MHSQASLQHHYTPATAIAVVIANMVGTGVFTSLGYQLIDIQSSFVLLLLWLRGQDTDWLLLPAAAFSLAAFAWLLTLHAAPSGRVYAAYGGVYVAVALGWLWSVPPCPARDTDRAWVKACCTA